MGRTSTPTYRIEAASNVHGLELFGWDCRRNGRPTDTSAEIYRERLNQSFTFGGHNFHLSESAGIIIHVYEIRIVRQKTGEVVACAKAPMFEVV